MLQQTQYDDTMSEIRENNKNFKAFQEGRKRIPVKDMNVPEAIAKKYGFSKVTVHVGFTRKELETMTREEANKLNYDMYMGYSGYDEDHNEPVEADLE